MSFNASRENKILVKISESTVLLRFHSYAMTSKLAQIDPVLASFLSTPLFDQGPELQCLLKVKEDLSSECGK